MAQMTNWLKRLGKPCRRRPVSVKVVDDLKGGWELWITDQDNRVLRCALTRQEVTALADALAKSLHRGKP